MISTNKVRYVGTLSSINSTESSVALVNVRCFGTEGRRGGASEMPAQAQIYPFVTFQGKDIADLQILDPGAPNVSI